MKIVKVKCLAVIPVTTQSLFKELVTGDQYNDYITIHCVRVHTGNYNAVSSLSKIMIIYLLKLLPALLINCGTTNVKVWTPS